MFKVTRQLGNPDFACVIRAEFAKYRNDCWTGSLQEKKSFVSYGDLLLINGTKYSTFQEAARAAYLSKFENFINEMLHSAASMMNLTEEEHHERILPKKNTQINRTT
ncbi:hypothetical protein TNCV_2474211 [Trichonephila clavipes]|nr:hypothetical protein TNCV_2474211 [Trichonephila clavipes]